MLNPDWSLWDEQSEGWRRDGGPPPRPRFSRYHKPSRCPVEDVDPPADPEPGVAPVREADRIPPFDGDQPESDFERAIETPPEPDFKEALRDRVFEAIDIEAGSQEIFLELCEALDQRLARDVPYMNGGVPLRGAVGRLCAELRLVPNWSRWQGEGWVGPIIRRRDPRPAPVPEGHDLE
jgi:hypothetical protein